MAHTVPRSKWLAPVFVATAQLRFSFEECHFGAVAGAFVAREADDVALLLKRPM